MFGFGGESIYFYIFVSIIVYVSIYPKDDVPF